LARENEWYKEGEQSERFLLRNPLSVPACNEAALNLVIAWHGTRIGNLTHDGFEWRWIPASSEGPFLVRQTTPGRLPPFIISLLPEGWLEHVLQDRDERAMLKSGKRYMSNITIVDDQRDLATLPLDVLVTPLSAFSEKGLFTGHYVGPDRSVLEEDFERNLAQIYEHSDTPRLSGIQIKAPMYLDQGGTLSPSIGTPFTHILKPAGTSGFESLPVIEWMTLILGKAVGFEVPSVSLVTMPSKMPPALLVVCFDIRNSASDTRRFALEDLCSVLNLPTEAKYDGTIERVARVVRSLSTSPDEDVHLLLRRALFAWLIADGDMHLKNMAMLKISEPGETRFSSVRMAPLYDAVTTRVFPRLERDRMALKLNGKDDNLRRADFRILATTAGKRSSDADRIIDSMIELLNDAVDKVAPPGSVILNKEAAAMTTRMLELCRERFNSFD
jgi:serine/threonine-protein kinase HipA